MSGERKTGIKRKPTLAEHVFGPGASFDYADYKKGGSVTGEVLGERLREKWENLFDRYRIPRPGSEGDTVEQLELLAKERGIEVRGAEPIDGRVGWMMVGGQAVNSEYCYSSDDKTIFISKGVDVQVSGLRHEVVHAVQDLNGEEMSVTEMELEAVLSGMADPSVLTQKIIQVSILQKVSMAVVEYCRLNGKEIPWRY